jgi:hypothetical protein
VRILDLVRWDVNTKLHLVTKSEQELFDRQNWFYTRGFRYDCR